VKSHIPPARSASWKWRITGLLLLATTINYMDRATLANAKERIVGELHLGDHDYGNLEFAFGWAFAAGSLVFGFLADRFSVRLLYPMVLAGWSVMGMITGWSQGFGELLVCRTLLGFFEAGHWPCAVKTTFALLSEKDRTFGNSLLQSGASIGAIITPQIMKVMMTPQPGSWRTPFIVVGAAGLLWVVLWLACVRPRDLDAASAPRKKTSLADLAGIFRSTSFWAVAMLLVGAQIVWQIFRAWLPTFLMTGRGYSEKAALNFVSIYYIATDVGCIVAGLIAVRLIRRGASPHDTRRTISACACVLTSLSILIPWLGKGWPLLTVLLLIGAGALALYPCYYTFTQELSPLHVGRITGLLAAWGWATTAPLQSAFGKYADSIALASHRYDLGLVIAGLAPWIGVISMKLLWRKSETPTPV
jgi:ACS family hexuronate transporter-like MFS transporter